MMNLFKISVQKTEGTIWKKYDAFEDNIKVNTEELGFGRELITSGSGLCLMANYCEYDNGSSSFMKDVEFPEQLSTY
jgi:hypothetical protein